LFLLRFELAGEYVHHEKTGTDSGTTSPA